MPPGDSRVFPVVLIAVPDCKVSSAQKTIKKNKKAKDPNAPKRPLNAFFEYVRQYRRQAPMTASLSCLSSSLAAMQAAVRRSEIRAQNPDMSYTDCGKQIGEEWRAMPDDVKAPYIAKAQASKAQYEIDKANYGKLNTLSTPVALVTINSCSAY